MATIKFTTRKIESLKAPADGQVDYWCEGIAGFGVRVSPSGRKSWIVMYRHGNRKRRLTLGTHPTLTLADARIKAKDALHDASHGRDPAAEKKAARAADTFAELAEEYMRRHAIPNKRSWRKDRAALDRDILPRFGKIKAGEVRRRHVIELLDDIVDRGAPIQANRTLAVIRRIYNWGIPRDLVKSNPCAMIERPSAEKRRERVLTDDEIRAVWAAFDEEKLMGALFKLRLVTAQRGGEVSWMRKEDIDGTWWTIPGAHTKNGKAHRVPLSSMALEIIEGLAPDTTEEEENAPLSQRSPWVFPSPKGEGPIIYMTKATARIRERATIRIWQDIPEAAALISGLESSLDRAPGIKEIKAVAEQEGVALPVGLLDFTPHDMRRTAATKMTGELGIGRLTVAKILNHAEGGATAVYDRHSYDPEKRQALEAWGQHLGDILADREADRGGKVIVLRDSG